MSGISRMRNNVYNSRIFCEFLREVTFIFFPISLCRLFVTLYNCLSQTGLFNTICVNYLFKYTYLSCLKRIKFLFIYINHQYTLKAIIKCLTERLVLMINSYLGGGIIIYIYILAKCQSLNKKKI